MTTNHGRCAWLASCTMLSPHSPCHRFHVIAAHANDRRRNFSMHVSSDVTHHITVASYLPPSGTPSTEVDRCGQKQRNSKHGGEEYAMIVAEMNLAVNVQQTRFGLGPPRHGVVFYSHLCCSEQYINRKSLSRRLGQPSPNAQGMSLSSHHASSTGNPIFNQIHFNEGVKPIFIGYTRHPAPSGWPA